MNLFPLLGGVGQPAVGLAADIGLAGPYSATENTPPALAQITLTFKRDGTWTIVEGANDTLAGAPASGTWAASSIPNAGDDYQMLYVVSSEVGSPVVVNDATGWTQISGDITVSVAKNGATASATITAHVQSITGGSILSDSASFSAVGA